jgi:hypothetical protein
MDDLDKFTQAAEKLWKPSSSHSKPSTQIQTQTPKQQGKISKPPVAEKTEKKEKEKAEFEEQKVNEKVMQQQQTLEDANFDSLLESLSLSGPTKPKPEKEQVLDEDAEAENQKEEFEELPKRRGRSRSQKGTKERRGKEKPEKPARAKYTLKDYIKESYTLKLCGRTLQGQVRLADGKTKCVFLGKDGASETEVQKLLQAANSYRLSKQTQTQTQTETQTQPKTKPKAKPKPTSSSKKSSSKTSQTYSDTSEEFDSIFQI